MMTTVYDHEPPCDEEPVVLADPETFGSAIRAGVALCAFLLSVLFVMG